MEHDKLATRLSLIIYKLNQGERLTIESLANEFGVSKRTIERDIARFSYFDIKKEGKEFFLDEFAVGKLNFDDIIDLINKKKAKITFVMAYRNLSFKNEDAIGKIKKSNSNIAIFSLQIL